MKIGVPKETVAGEKRVAATPTTVTQLIKLGFDVVIEKDAGAAASFDDSDYIATGAEIGEGSTVWQSDIIFKVNAPEVSDAHNEIDKLQAGTTLVSFIWPAQHAELLQALQARQISVLAMDSVPRISRAQALDALSSMANIAGYRAVVEASHQFGRFFTGQITAAGKVPPAKVLVAGAGVAGLAAIGAAGSLGAIVRAFDVRPEVKEQVESMGAQFLTVDVAEAADSSDGYAKEMSETFKHAAEQMYAEQAKEVDIIITTALIPGKPAPTLITKAMVDSMKRGSVIVDLAAANGGNCEYTQADKVITTDNGVTVIGYTDMVSRLPTQSSQLYATNLVNLMKLLCKNKDGEIDIDFDDAVIRGLTVVRDGELTWPAPTIKVSAAPKTETNAANTKANDATNAPIKPAPQSDPKRKWIGLGIAAAVFGWIAHYSPPEFLAHFTVFTLACVVGYYVVWNVTHALHTPLMSVTNAISGIIIVGALLQIGQGHGLVNVLAFIAVLIASINIFGGFTVTKRMLEMFRKDK
uniref:Re/Si-specific NAD(P)(+) transhydrogenase subunit alpha n=1 Tax=Thaumasiovibrio occultus TaxID=1891184 RepID=UPI000B34C2FD|nr:Re/Si-specific NAD(P)(+) transhydrogenase subunit alpha [Thaumasiovibrio occultus]